jgi:hypothetical protein
MGFNDREMRTWLSRMGNWWGYVVVEPGPSDTSSSRSVLNWVVRPTPGGRKALEAWQPLTGIIEKRWQQRFGKDVIDRLEGENTQAYSKKGELPRTPTLG